MKALRKELLLPGFLAAYLASFSILAIFGGYMFLPSGHFRPVVGLSSPDSLVWQPFHGTFYSFRDASGNDTYQANFAGYFYAPLILFVQKTFRPSITFIAPDGSAVKPAPPPRMQWHPSFRREVEKLENAERGPKA